MKKIVSNVALFAVVLMTMFGGVAVVQADDAAIKAAVKEHEYPKYLDRVGAMDQGKYWYPHYLDRSADK